MSDKILTLTLGLVISLSIIALLVYLVLRYKRKKKLEASWTTCGDYIIMVDDDHYHIRHNTRKTNKPRREVDKAELEALKAKRAGVKGAPKDGVYIGEYDKPTKGTSKRKAERLKAKARRKKKVSRSLDS